MSAKPETKTAETRTPELVNIEVDGQALQVPKGSMLIQATDAAGIYIPRFCYHDKLSIAANCRMCLVEVEKSPKPLPACATPVAEGMKVYTRSAKARDAQRGTMEFLLINHPLDCPICDQGGECDLQDLSLGYGKDVSRYAESKRVIKDKNLGPLIATDMTRCIYCTRCVRFGKEIANVTELGGTGRGEHTEIGTYIERSVNSELSGNVIDLCPVGALTSKPFRYTARAWELTSHPSISPHDCVGSNINVQTRRGVVMRVLPRDNEAINEVWLADRDRFSYEALNSEERLKAPMIRVNGRWEQVDWGTALEFAADGLKKVVAEHGAQALGALAAPTSTLEEFYLLARLVRGLGSGNVDHRLRQADFGDDDIAPVFPALGCTIPELDALKAVLLVGSNIRKDQPLLAHRLRKAHRKGARIMAINPVDYDFAYRLAHGLVVAPGDMPGALAGVAKALAALKGATLPPLPAWAAAVEPGDTARAIARTLAEGSGAAVLLGNYAASHAQGAALRALARLIAELAGARLGYLPEANSAAGWLAGAIPHRGPAGAPAAAGLNAYAMIAQPRKGYLLLGVEPELDCLDGARARAAMGEADFVVMMTPFRPSPYRLAAVEYADVLLPAAPFTETAGSFVNCEGRRQAFCGAAQPLGETRPGWKILRVLGSMMGLAGFGYNDIEDVRREIDLSGVAPGAGGAWRLSDRLETPADALQRIVEVPIYAVDAIVRRAPALQATADNPPPAARMDAAQAARLGLVEGDEVNIVSEAGGVALPLVVDARVPAGCVLVPAGYPETVALGGHGPVSVAKAEHS